MSVISVVGSRALPSRPAALSSSPVAHRYDLVVRLAGPSATPHSLIDADMGAFYMWVNQQRLSGAREASFLVWFENHSEAFVISPTLPGNTESNSPVDMQWLLAQVGQS